MFLPVDSLRLVLARSVRQAASLGSFLRAALVVEPLALLGLVGAAVMAVLGAGEVAEAVELPEVPEGAVVMVTPI